MHGVLVLWNSVDYLIWPQRKYNTNQRAKIWNENVHSRRQRDAVALILMHALAVCGYVSWGKTGDFMAAALPQEVQTKSEINLEMRWRDADTRGEKAHCWDHINRTLYLYDSFLE